MIFSNYLFEGKHCYAVLDNFPLNKGHILIISKEHYENLFEAPMEVKSDILIVMDQAKEWLDKHYTPQGYNVGVNCGIAAGQSVFHLHVHLIPRYTGDCLNPVGGVRSVIPQKQMYENTFKYTQLN